MPGSVIVAGARTPMGRLLGGLQRLLRHRPGRRSRSRPRWSGPGSPATRSTTSSWARCCRPGPARSPARQAAVKAGIPMGVPSLTINKVCLSGLDAIALADQLIRGRRVRGGRGRRHGVDDQRAAPAARVCARATSTARRDGRLDGVRRADRRVRPRPDGRVDRPAQPRLGISRAEQDEFAARSHQRAAAAQKNGLFDEEIVPVQVPQRRGDPIEITRGRGHPRGHHRRGAGQAAAGVQHGRHDHRRQLVADLRRRLRGGGDVAGPRPSGAGRPCWPRSVRTARSPARTTRCSRSRPTRSGRRSARPGWTWPTSTSSRSTRRSPRSASSRCASSASGRRSVNVNGGAIALGHPIGMCGARIALHLALELRRRGGGLGAAALCGGGGQGDALLLKV